MGLGGYPATRQQVRPRSEYLSPIVLKFPSERRPPRLFFTCRSETHRPRDENPHMPTYSYANSLRNAYKVNWRIEEVLGTRRFDPSKRWLPDSLSGASA